MHISYFKRPLFILLCAYALFIILTPNNKIPSGDAFYSVGRGVTLEGCLTEPLRERPEFSTAVIKTKTGKTYVRFPPGFHADMKDCVSVTGTLKAPFGLDIDGNFNWKQYLANKNIFTEMTAESAKITKRAPLPYRALNALRNSILKTFTSNFDADSAAILKGITLGEKSEISDHARKYFNDAGVMHLLVASGANVGFVCLIVYALCALIGVKNAWRLPLALVFAGFYTLLAGADAPLLRAYLMTLSAGLGLMLGRNSGAFQGLITAAFIILILEPKSIYEASFQMSFLATFIIIFSFGRVKVETKLPRAPAFILQIFLTTLAVQLALIPIYTNVFYRFSLMAFVSNIFLVPLAEVIMLLGFLYYILRIKIVWALAWACLEVFKILVHFFGGFSFSALTVPAINAFSIVLFYVALLLVYRVNKKYVLPCILLLIISPFLTLLFRGDFVYLLNNNRSNAVVVKADKLMVFSDEFNPEIIKNFILSKGYLKADIVYGKQADIAKEQIVPFKDFWPGDDVNGLKTAWGLMRSRAGTWTNTGYSGTRLDSVSYTFDNITIGGRADFVLKNGEVFDNRKNASVQLFSK